MLSQFKIETRGDSVELSGFIALRGKKLRLVGPAFCCGCALRHRGKIVDPCSLNASYRRCRSDPNHIENACDPNIIFAIRQSIPNPAPGTESASLATAGGLNPPAMCGQRVSKPALRWEEQCRLPEVRRARR